MGSRPQIQDAPNALRATLERARSEYEPVVRQVRWGDGPIYVCGTAGCAALAVAAGYALESLLGLPVVARPVEVFTGYALHLLRQRSVLLTVSPTGEEPEALELARGAQAQGATLVVMTCAPGSTLAKSADQVFCVRAEGEGETPAVAIAFHAALNYLALAAARVLRRPEPQWDSLEREFGELPGQMDWVLTQLTGAIRSLAAEVGRFPRLPIVGGGFYHYPALRAGRRLQTLAGLPAQGMEASEFASAPAGFTRQGDAVLFVSGSRSRIKKLVHRSAAQARVLGAHVLSITDGQDRELQERSDLGLLIPSSAEAVMSTLSLCMLEWLAVEAARTMKHSPPSPMPSGEPQLPPQTPRP